ncbi:serine/threonine-protein phosphatase PP-Z [Cryptococcus bacillisporus CA1873]|uniref:Serine/threonine-protein phosphatase PP-Z n=1 Tax=Cryptococcus bacillisporus CA1873 TaxID=1296111 RepID=A0ABR5B4X3_CRYGA|nr:serine/threonine-protein phosphatase PP-Z [Cryptococcus bacillisporus CA1873]|eukprot:KIR58636.1 serine/threonine-protein phosphatase PP-Z [Cryptococcus gattii CA1873]
MVRVSSMPFWPHTIWILYVEHIWLSKTATSFITIEHLSPCFLLPTIAASLTTLEQSCPFPKTCYALSSFLNRWMAPR